MVLGKDGGRRMSGEVEVTLVSCLVFLVGPLDGPSNATDDAYLYIL